MRIGIDLDDVAADFRYGFRKAYFLSFGKFVDTPIDWDLRKITHFTTHKALWDWIEKDHPRFFHDLFPVFGAVNALNELKQAGHNLIFITDKPVWAEDAPKYWLEKWDIPYDEIHITKDKAAVPCDVYFDDGPHNLLSFTTCTMAKVVRMIQPWNAPMYGVYDVTNWDEFVDYIRSLEE